MPETKTPDLRPRGWTERTEHGGGVATLHFDGTGGVPAHYIGVEHRCTRQRDGETLLIAPFIHTEGPQGHQLVSRYPLTLSPSILCLDCGLHGFIIDGAWRSS